MSVEYLKSSFFAVSLICLLLLTFYIAIPSHKVLKFKSSFYFYEYEPIYRQNFLFTLREKFKCEETNPFLVILVFSSPTDVKARQAIRTTWGSQKLWWGNQVLTLFLLGKVNAEDNNFALSIEDESILYGDIIQQDFADTYNNLTLKAIMGFQWVTEYCTNTRYIMKTDSDVFINTGNLVKFLLNSNASENFYTGYPLVDNFSYRGFYGKTYISYEMYPFTAYPPYCGGVGYILDARLAQRVYEIMSHVKPIKFEDVYVGICLNILKVGISIPEDKELFFLYRISFDVCKYKHLIAVHGILPQEMIAFWQEVTKETSLPCH